MRIVCKADEKVRREKHNVTDMQSTVDEQYLRVLAYLMIASENLRESLNRSSLYNIKALYPPLTVDDETVAEFMISLKRHVLG